MSTKPSPVIEREVTALDEAFRDAFRGHAAGVAVVTADPGDGPVALIVTSLFSVSVDPPLLAFSASASSSSTEALLAAETVVVHVLARSDIELARRCAVHGADRFRDAEWARLATGEPCFTDVGTRILGRIVARHPAGTGTIVVVQAEDVASAAPGSEQRPLVYHDRTWHALDEHSRVDAREQVRER